ncbi:MAG: Gfo/Idh/MocA family oxidoreductase, partial [Clostridiales bacterium]|nr:Gfo/Idh/MocA family oxidoreductase [Clostridiales bacterium]
MSRPVRFGIVGCGVISRWHADSIESIDNAKLIGATDPNTDALHSFIQDYGIKGFATLEEMLKSDEVNAISICTPSGLHAPQAILAANYGVNVIVEKPMAITLREIDEIIRACEKSGIKFSVISQLRFSETVQRVRQAVKEKEIGDVMLCDLYMKYYRSPDYYASSSWRGTWDMDGGGALMNQGIHGIDVLQYIMGPVKSIFGQIRTLTHAIEGEDTATAILEFQNGALGVIEGTTSVYPGYSRRIEIHGDQGSIILEE